MKAGKQTTLGARATVSGIGVHSGLPVISDIASGGRRTPASCSSGLTPQGRPEREIRAHARYVTATELATVLGDDDPARCVSTVEHVMAALCGLGVDNALIEIDGAEAPIMDGSAAAFVAAIDQAGMVGAAERRAASPRCSSRFASQSGDAYGELTPVRSRLPRRRRDRFRPSADRPAVDRDRGRARPLSAANSRAPAPSAS